MAAVPGLPVISFDMPARRSTRSPAILDFLPGLADAGQAGRFTLVLMYGQVDYRAL